MSFATTSVRSKIAFVCLVLAFVLHIVGFATPAWVILDLTMEKNSSTVVVTVQFGLWSLCSCVETECFCLNILSARGWLLTVEILETIGLGFLFTSGITTIVMLCRKSTTSPNANKIILQLIVSGISIAIGVAVYRAQKVTVNELTSPRLSLIFQATGLRSSLGYSLILCAVASGIYLFVCLPLLILDQRLNNCAGSQSETSCEMTPYPAVTCMDGQHLLPAQSHVTVHNTTLESSRQVYGKQLQYPNHDQVVAVQGKACVGDQYSTVRFNDKPKL